MLDIELTVNLQRQRQVIFFSAYATYAIDIEWHAINTNRRDDADDCATAQDNKTTSRAINYSEKLLDHKQAISYQAST